MKLPFRFDWDDGKKLLILSAFLFLPIIFIFRTILGPTIRWSQFSGNEWQFLIPLIFTVMVWHNRKELFAISFRPSYIFGSILLCLATGIYLFGRIFLTDFFVEFSFLFFLFGTTLLLAGWKITKLLAWPLLYLMFLTSLFNYFQPYISYYLQISAATLSVFALNLLGFNAVREFTYFRLPSGILNVADACSGFNQFISLVALSIPIGYLRLRRKTFQFLLIFLSLPLSILLNSIRITLIGIWNYHEMKADLHGPYDIFYAPFIFLLGLILLYFIVEKIEHFNPQAPSGPSITTWHFSTLLKPSVIVFLFCIIIETVLFTISRNPAKPFKENFIASTDHVCQINQIFKTPLLIKTFKRFKPDFQFTHSFTSNGYPIYFHYSYFKKQTPGNSVTHYLFPKGEKSSCTLDFSNNKQVTANLLSFNNEYESGTLVWWYTAAGQNKTEIPELKDAIRRNMLTAGTASSDMFLFYIPGFFENTKSNIEICNIINRFCLE